MARPRIKRSLRRTHRIVFRLTDKQMLPLAQKAAALDVSANDLARKLTLTKLERLVVKAEHSYDPAIIKQLYHIGHNLNQLVKNAHIFGRLSPRIERLCQRIDALMDEVIGREVE